VIAYQHAVALGDQIWQAVGQWESFSRWSIGLQLTKAVDSIAANIAEAHGRSTRPDQLRLLVIARGSAYEAEHWINVAVARSLLDEGAVEGMAEVTRTLSGLIRSFRP
jgi:four helix bundle protein